MSIQNEWPAPVEHKPLLFQNLQSRTFKSWRASLGGWKVWAAAVGWGAVLLFAYVLIWR